MRCGRWVLVRTDPSAPLCYVGQVTKQPHPRRDPLVSDLHQP